MDCLSMRELRCELDRIGVDYSACIEKTEMIDLLHKNTSRRIKGKGEMPKKLSIKSIKERLTTLGVDFSNCLEIGELVELLVASEQGHNVNPFRKSKTDSEKNGRSHNSTLNNGKKASKDKGDQENKAALGNSGRSAALAGLRDITEKANRRSSSGAKAEMPAEQQTTVILPVKDIDAADTKNVQAVTEYVRDIYAFLRRDEVKYMPGNYLDKEDRVISLGQRAGIVDWIVEMHAKFRMQPAVLYLAINVLDRFMAVSVDAPSSNTVLGCACLLIAAKIEEIYPPKVRDIRRTLPTISATQLCKMERLILNLSLIHISEPTRLLSISYAVFCLKKKKKTYRQYNRTL
eukprot:TRINITY_DN18936_c0_g1_i19.p1 TRINITY_DN18936_c0_g1~~TRINITY_DN18936_c0_g1_i19.p1  ORF type:complete len:347 (+),score=111.51 TRINITY_DN18936_c0_g1_i19:40-1080(+)